MPASTSNSRPRRRTRPTTADIARLHASPRCAARARTRDWQPCRNPAVKGKRRCRMHGGKNEGGKIGNKNALKHGHYRQTVLRERREIRQFIRWCDGVLTAIAHNAK
jgi:hypothetical protein